MQNGVLGFDKEGQACSAALERGDIPAWVFYIGGITETFYS